MDVKCDHREPIWPLIIIGAGPIGIEAAIYAKKLGVEPLILESAPVIAPTLEALGNLTLYPAAKLMMTPLGLEWVGEASSINLFTAKTYRDFYLLPLVEKSGLRIELNCRVESIARSGVTLGVISVEARKAAPFKLLLTTEQGPQTLFAEHIIDASGVYQAPLPLGDNRVVVEGEAEHCLNIEYQIVDFVKHFEHYNGRKILLFGDTYLAYSSLQRFVELKARWSPTTQLTCIKEQAARPFYKDELTKAGAHRYVEMEANIQQDSLLSNKVSFVDQARVMAIHFDAMEESNWMLDLCRSNQPLRLQADRVISNYGFQVDPSLWQDLHIESSYVTGGPAAYAHALLNALKGGEVSQAMPAYALKNPEPNFYIIGAKSYGSQAGFISRIGLGQIVALFQLISQDKTLNLYADFAENLILADSKTLQGLAFKLSDSEELYKTLTAFIQEVVFQTDLQQRITYLSDSWFELTGIDTAYYIGLDWQELFEDASDYQKTTLTKDLLSVNQGEGQNLFSIKCANGARKWVIVKPRQLVDKQNQPYGVISSLKDVTEQIELSQKLDELKAQQKNQTYHDDKTGAATRLKLTEMLRLNHSLFRRYGTPFSVLMFAMDQFKAFSQAQGSGAASVLRENFAHMVKNSLRISDEFGCWQGEKFIIVAASNELVDAYQLAEKLRQMTSSSLLVPDTEITISLGVASIEVDETIESLLERAEKLFRQARLDGKNTVKY